ncbi:MAG TPA: ribosome biogenesis GTP-binding protein YihA/YsxC [Terriglobales bacterium]
MKVRAQFLKSAADAAHFPSPGPPEIAFLGRSNVGKSSLINSLLGEKMAKTSSTPGRTRTINFFEVRRPGQPRAEMLFADLPGYGYAKLPRELTAEWPKFIEPYLQRRPTLALCIVLVDANVPPQQSDQQLVEWLQSTQRHFVITATKSDRLSGNKLTQSLNALRSQFQTERILPFSARTGTGRDELWKEILASTQGTPESSK